MHERNGTNMEYLTISEVAAILRKSPESIRSDVTRNPNILPPFAKVGGRILFIACLIHDWVLGKLVNYIKVDIAAATTGRPRKVNTRNK